MVRCGNHPRLLRKHSQDVSVSVDTVIHPGPVNFIPQFCIHWGYFAVCGKPHPEVGCILLASTIFLSLFNQTSGTSPVGYCT